MSQLSKLLNSGDAVLSATGISPIEINGVSGVPQSGDITISIAGGGDVSSITATAPLTANGLSGAPQGGAIILAANNATTTTVGVASFDPTNFSVSGAGAVTSNNFTINTAAPLSGGGSITLGGTLNLSLTGSGFVSSVTGTTNQITASPTTGAVVLSIPSTFIAPGTIRGTTSVSSAIYLVTGSSTGTISILPQAAAGTFNFNLPITAGTSGFFLTSAGGAAAPMTWTSISSSGAITIITGNDSVAESPTASGNFNIVGTGSITTTGSLNTETISLTGLTNHNVLVGAGTATVTKVAPSATAGIPLVSNGSSADPSFTTAVVAGGGTGAVTLTQHGVLLGQGTSAITATSVGATGTVLAGNTGADPTFQTLSSISVTSITGTTNQIVASSPTGAVTLSFPATGGISLGSYQANTPPVGGILLPGPIVLGQTSTSTGASIAVNNTQAYGYLLLGTTTQGKISYGFFNEQTIVETGAFPIGGFVDETVYTVSTGITSPLAASFYSSVSFTGNIGTITNFYGFYFDGAGAGAGTITNIYGGYFTEPTVGTNKTALHTDNASIGTYVGATVPPTNGLIVSGQVGLGISSVVSTVSVQLSYSNPTSLYFSGNSTSIDASNSQSGIYLNQTYSPPANASAIYGIQNSPIVIAPSAHTITSSYGYYCRVNVGANVGTISTSYGMYVDGGSSSAGTITTAYGGYFANPAFGTTKAALYSDNHSIGYAATTPPTNGLIVEGNVGIGLTSAAQALSLSGSILQQGNTPGYQARFRDSTGNTGVDIASGGVFAESDVFSSLSLTLGSWNASAHVTVMTLTASGQVGIGTTSPAAGALLDLTSSTLGLLLPRTNTPTANITSPSNGMIAYNTGANTVQMYNSSASIWFNLNGWQLIASATAAGVASLSFTNSALIPLQNYQSWFVNLEYISPVTNNANLEIQVQQVGSPVVSGYKGGITTNAVSSTNTWSNLNATSAIDMGLFSNTVESSAWLIIQNTQGGTGCTWSGMVTTNGNVGIVAGSSNITSIDGLTIMFSSGNINLLEVQIYGLYAS